MTTLIERVVEGGGQDGGAYFQVGDVFAIPLPLHMPIFKKKTCMDGMDIPYENCLFYCSNLTQLEDYHKALSIKAVKFC